MENGKINVTTENIFPIIKQFLYSDQEIFLRELISNAVDATQKLNTISLAGDFSGEVGNTTIELNIDKENKTITISDKGIGMTAKEIDKYINQIAFSGAESFVKKYKDKASVIGHFGLGFYSSFMVADRVDIISQSYKKGKTVKWSCDGSPEYTIEDVEKKDRGTDIVLHISEDSTEFLEDARINELLTKYCKFLPVEIAFGKKKEWKDGKDVELDELNVINDTEPAWTKKPADLKDEDYNEFYRKLYPSVVDDPLFHIHLNVDYPFNLTGILYFPKIGNNVEVQKNKIQLYSNQVFVTDSVEDIVPEFLTLLHGVIDSPDIPLNVSRSYLQSDANVKKISSHITKKVADKLNDIFKNNRDDYESKWDDLSIFIKYGMLTEEKFYDKASSFCMFKNVDGKCFTFDEYRDVIKTNQTDKDDNVVYLYTTNKDEQYSFVQAAKDKGYDVAVLDGQLDTHFVNHLETKLEKSKFVRVDADVADKLIAKEEEIKSTFTTEEESELRPVFKSVAPADINFEVTFEGLTETESPIIITQSEFMRRMKDMSKMGGGGMNFYGDLPDSFNIVVNTNHKLVKTVLEDEKKALSKDLETVYSEIKTVEQEKEAIQKLTKDKKEEEISQEEKDKLAEVDKKITDINSKKDEKLTAFGKDNMLVKQLVDLALLSNNMLKGESLTNFVKRSVELIEK